MNPNDIFWLARYAYNQLAPLFAQAKAIEPTIDWAIEVRFADKESVYKGHHINVTSHWKGRPGMFQHENWMRDKADVDRVVAKVRKDVEALQPLEDTAA